MTVLEFLKILDIDARPDFDGQLLREEKAFKDEMGIQILNDAEEIRLNKFKLEKNREMRAKYDRTLLNDYKGIMKRKIRY